ncbi:MAG: signal peptidase I [Christensenellales bacterium]|jgi:signal peptidase
MRRAGKIIKGALGALSSLALVVVLVYCVCMWLFPQQVTDLVGFRFYTIATGSMEPTIPTGSMVLVKSLAPGEEPAVGSIVTFRADRLGDSIVLTHYLRDIQVEEDGQVRYVTRGENSQRDDDYATHREDLLGTYVFHVPFLGRLGQFLRSTQALIMYLTIGVILLIYYLVSLRLDRKAQQAPASAPPQSAAPPLDAATGDVPAQAVPTDEPAPPTMDASVQAASTDEPAPPTMDASVQAASTDEPAPPTMDASAQQVSTAEPVPPTMDASVQAVSIAEPAPPTMDASAQAASTDEPAPPTASSPAQAAAPAEEAPSSVKVAPLQLHLQPGEPPVLAIEDRALTRQAGRVVLRATARNVSGRTLSYVKLTVRFLDGQDQERACAQVYLAQQMAPGEVKSWQSHVPNDPAIRHERIAICCK